MVNLLDRFSKVRRTASDFGFIKAGDGIAAVASGPGRGRFSDFSDPVSVDMESFLQNSSLGSVFDLALITEAEGVDAGVSSTDGSEEKIGMHSVVERKHFVRPRPAAKFGPISSHRTVK